MVITVQGNSAETQHNDLRNQFQRTIGPFRIETIYAAWGGVGILAVDNASAPSNEAEASVELIHVLCLWSSGRRCVTQLVRVH